MEEWKATNVPTTIATIEVVPPEGYADMKFDEEITKLTFNVVITPTVEFDDWAKTYGLEYSMTVTSKEGVCVIFPNKEAAMWFKMRWL